MIESLSGIIQAVVLAVGSLLAVAIILAVGAVVAIVWALGHEWAP